MPPSSLSDEPDDLSLSRFRLSFYLSLARQGHGGNTVVESFKQKFPWIVKYATYGITEDRMRFKAELLLTNVEAVKRCYAPELFPLSRKHHKTKESFFIKEAVIHFMTHGMQKYIEESWERSALSSGSTKGVLRALIFSTTDTDQRELLISLLFELKAITSLYKWRIAYDGASHPFPPNYNTCLATRKLFWGIVHLYAGMCGEFDKSRLVKEWDSSWYEASLASRKSNILLQTIRAVVCRSAGDCDLFMKMYKEMVNRRVPLMLQLRAAVVRTAMPGDVHFIRSAIRDIQGCELLAERKPLGVPMPPFDLSPAFFILDRAENLLQIMDFIKTDVVDVRRIHAETPAATQPIGERPDIDLLVDAVWVAPEIGIVRRLLVDEEKWAAPELGMRQLLIEEEEHEISAEELLAKATQAHSDDQHRRAVRREVKRIRAVRRDIMQFAVEQQAGLGVLEMRRLAAGMATETRTLMEEVDRVKALIGMYAAEETLLLTQHVHEQRRRQFLLAGTVFLPSAMFEAEVECGLCLGELKWNTDLSIGFVTCCREFGYVCGDCLAKPHSDTHELVRELEIVRIVRGVRRAAGI